MIRLTPRWLILALLALTAAAYANIFSATWQFDDFNVIVNDVRVQSLAAWWQAQPSIRSLFKLSAALNHASGFGLHGFQAFNLLIHCTNAVLVFLLVQRLLKVRRNYSEFELTLITFFTAALFALHPAQTEAVTYISGRSVSLSSMFILLGVYLAPIRDGDLVLRNLVAPLLCFVLAVLVRETAIIAVLLLALYWHVLRLPLRPVFKITAQYFLPPLAVLLLLLWLMPMFQTLVSIAWQWQGLWSLATTQAQAVVYLLAVFLGLVSLNADPAVLLAPSVSAYAITCVLMVLFAILIAIDGLRRNNLLGFALSWFLLSLLPTHSILQRLDLVNDRHLYLAMPALALLAALIFVQALHYLGRIKWLAIAVAAFVLMLLVTATFMRNLDYQTEAIYWQDVVQKSPHNPRAYNNLGIAFANDGETTLALSAFESALALDSTYTLAAVNARLLEEGNWPRVNKSEGSATAK